MAWMPFAQAKDIGLEVGLVYEALVQGDYQASYDGLLGGEVKYDLFKTGKWQHFLKGGYREAQGGDSSDLSLWDLGFGSRYPIASWFDQPVYADYSVGLVYASEDFSNSLIDRSADNSFSDTELQLGLGLSIDISQRLRSHFSISQIGGNGTAVGLSFSYSF